jgi:hypothetical protein
MKASCAKKWGMIEVIKKFLAYRRQFAILEEYFTAA